MTHEWLLLALCLLGSWFFSGIETGLISINRLRLRHLVRRQVPGAAILQRFLQQPDRLLGTALTGNNIVTTLASVLAVSLGQRAFGPQGSWVGTVAVTLVLLVGCEYFPKAWFQSFPAQRSLPFARLLDLLRLLLAPLSVPLMGLVKRLVPEAEAGRQAPPFVTREEIVHLASEGTRSGLLSPAEHRMIHEVIQLKTKPCREIMTPRERIVHVQATSPVAEILELARQREFNRLPVFDPTQKVYVGVINVFDVLADEHSEGKCARDYQRPPQLVADYTPVDHVLPRMRVTRQPLVLVTNERFEVIGLVTLEDVLEEVIGSL